MRKLLVTLISVGLLVGLMAPPAFAANEVRVKEKACYLSAGSNRACVIDDNLTNTSCTNGNFPFINARVRRSSGRGVLDAMTVWYVDNEGQIRTGQKTTDRTLTSTYPSSGDAAAASLVDLNDDLHDGAAYAAIDVTTTGYFWLKITYGCF